MSEVGFEVTAVTTTSADGTASSQCCVQREVQSAGWVGVELCQRRGGHGGRHLFPSSPQYFWVCEIPRLARTVRNRCRCLFRRHKWSFQLWDDNCRLEGGRRGGALVCGRCYRIDYVPTIEPFSRRREATTEGAGR